MNPSFVSTTPLPTRRPTPTTPTCSLAPPPLPHPHQPPPPARTPPPPAPDLPDPSDISSLAPPVIGRETFQETLHASPAPYVVVMFHARWCRTCKTLASKLPRVAGDFPTLAWFRVDFAEMNNRPLCAELSVKMLPTFHIYARRDGDMVLLEQFTAGPFGVKRLVERLSECMGQV